MSQDMIAELDQVADDLTGKVFGDLTVQHPLPRAAQPSWLCQCVCGHRLAVTTENLLNGNKTKCSSGCNGTTGRVDDMERRRLPPPELPGLEHSIAACLQGGDINADQLGELIADTRSAISQASAAAKAARSRAFDPAIVDPRARRNMEQSDHLAKRLRLALPQLQSKLQKLYNAAEYRQWSVQFDRVRLKHAAAANKLREVYINLEHQLVAALRTAREVDAEVGKVLRDKPRDNPLADNDGKQLLSVECCARHLGSIHPDYSLMHMKIPAFAEPNKFSWPPPTPPILPQDVMPVLRGPGPNWHRDIAERDAERRRDAVRMADYHNRMAREREDKENAAARAARLRNGGMP